MLESGWFEGVFLNLCHLDDPLLSSFLALIGRSIADIRRLVVNFWYMLGLSGFDLAMGNAFESESGTFGRLSERSVVRTLHLPVLIRKIGAIGKGDEIFSPTQQRDGDISPGPTFKARLDPATRGATVLRNRIVPH